jgi:hypothetical protein
MASLRLVSRSFLVRSARTLKPPLWPSSSPLFWARGEAEGGFSKAKNLQKNQMEKGGRYMKKQLELKLNVNTLPPPTIPATSWADYADFRIMPISLLKVAIGAADVARRSA